MTHLFSLPMFLSFSSTLGQHFTLWYPSFISIYRPANPYCHYPRSQGESFGPISWLWAMVLVNIVSQYVCIRGVYALMAASGPLSVNLTITARKFISLLLRSFPFPSFLSVSSPRTSWPSLPSFGPNCSINSYVMTYLFVLASISSIIPSPSRTGSALSSSSSAASFTRSRLRRLPTPAPTSKSAIKSQYQ